MENCLRRLTGFAVRVDCCCIQLAALSGVVWCGVCNCRCLCVVHLIGCLLVCSYGSRSAVRGSFSKETLRLRSQMVCVTFACVVCGHMAAGYKHHMPWCEPWFGVDALSLICCITHLVFCENTFTFLCCCLRCRRVMCCICACAVSVQSAAVVVAGLGLIVCPLCIQSQ